MKLILDYLKKNWVLILTFIISSFAIYFLYRYVFYKYPDVIRGIFYNYFCPTNETQFGYNIGTFGDMYGLLNSFLSGLAFIGLLITIILQILQFKQEKDFQRAETSENRIKDANNVLEFIKNAGGILKEENTELIRKIDEVLLSRSIESLNPTTDILYEKLCSFDLERSYTSYKLIHSKGENDTVFRIFQLFKNAFDFKSELSHMGIKVELERLHSRKRVASMDLIKNLRTEVDVNVLNDNQQLIYSQIMNLLANQINDDPETDLNFVLKKIKDSYFLRNPLISYSYYELTIVNNDENKLISKYFTRLSIIKQGLENINESLTTRLNF